jgi:hypothetical protein
VLISIVVACREAVRRIPRSSRRLALGFLLATALLSVIDNTFSTAQFVMPFSWFLASLASGSLAHTESPSKRELTSSSTLRRPLGLDRNHAGLFDI